VIVKPIHCFLDLDGVLADFVGGICKAHNKPNPHTIGQSGDWDIPKLWGMTEEEFYRPCEFELFWMELELTPEARNLYHGLRCAFGEDNITFLTKPTRSASAYSGKYRWIKKNFGCSSKILMGEAPKALLARPEHLLVDDYDKNVDEWRVAGGEAIMVPRPWNRLHAQAGDVLAHVDSELCKFLDKSKGWVEQEKLSVAKDTTLDTPKPTPTQDGGEVRVTDPETGAQKGAKLACYNQIMPETLCELAEHFGKGAKKYSAFNWAKGMDWSLSYSALNRHLNQFWGGEDRDVETGSKHIIAVAWHAFVLAYYMDHNMAKDDRPTRANLEALWAKEKKETK